MLETGVDSIAIKDMSGILTPMAAYESWSAKSKTFLVRLHLHCHTPLPGWRRWPLLRRLSRPGVDGVNTAISSMRAPPATRPPKRWWRHVGRY
ncbi:hypothetical protein KCP71_01545 [Salmonella enterica subsp. enterica]|nr:hypothetical protein KCP71_01545 [Salmonella enterica subsp. enterica]